MFWTDYNLDVKMVLKSQGITKNFVRNIDVIEIFQFELH